MSIELETFAANHETSIEIIYLINTMAETLTELGRQITLETLWGQPTVSQLNTLEVQINKLPIGDYQWGVEEYKVRRAITDDFRAVMAMDNCHRLYKGEWVYNEKDAFTRSPAFRLVNHDGEFQEVDFSKSWDNGGSVIQNNIEMERLSGFKKLYCASILDVVKANPNMTILGVLDEVTYVRFWNVSDVESSIFAVETKYDWLDCDSQHQAEENDILECLLSILLGHDEAGVAKIIKRFT